MAKVNVLVNGVLEAREFVYAFQTNYGRFDKTLIGEHLKLVPRLRPDEVLTETPDGRLSITSPKPPR